MKANDLLEALTLTLACVDRNADPEWGCIHIHAQDGNLFLQSTNRHIAAFTSVVGEVEDIPLILANLRDLPKFLRTHRKDVIRAKLIPAGIRFLAGEEGEQAETVDFQEMQSRERINIGAIVPEFVSHWFTADRDEILAGLKVLFDGLTAAGRRGEQGRTLTFTQIGEKGPEVVFKREDVRVAVPVKTLGDPSRSPDNEAFLNGQYLYSLVNGQPRKTLLSFDRKSDQSGNPEPSNGEYRMVRICNLLRDQERTTFLMPMR